MKNMGLLHGDVSPANLHYYHNMEGEVVGLLNDFDLNNFYLPQTEKEEARKARLAEKRKRWTIDASKSG